MRDAKKLADKVLKLKIKASDEVCLWRDSKSVAEGVRLHWGDIRALALAVSNKRK